MHHQSCSPSRVTLLGIRLPHAGSHYEEVKTSQWLLKASQKPPKKYHRPAEKRLKVQTDPFRDG